MNERIRELMELATVRVDPDDREWVFFKVDQAKFAELIVRECAAIVEEDGSAVLPLIILKHFGVEE